MDRGEERKKKKYLKSKVGGHARCQKQKKKMGIAIRKIKLIEEFICKTK